MTAVTGSTGMVLDTNFADNATGTSDIGNGTTYTGCRRDPETAKEIG